MNEIKREFLFKGVIPDRSKSLTRKDAGKLDHYFIIYLAVRYFTDPIPIRNNRLYLTNTNVLRHSVDTTLWRDDSSRSRYIDRIPFANYWDAWAFFNKMIAANK